VLTSVPKKLTPRSEAIDGGIDDVVDQRVTVTPRKLWKRNQ
jgi:hypothetical protein